MVDDSGGGRHRPHKRRSRLPKRRTAWALLGFGFVLTMIGLVAAGRLGAEEDRLMHTGLPTPAEVVAGAGAESPGFSHTDVVLRYDFGGHTYRVSLGRNDESPTAKLGDRFTLYVDPQHPQQVASTDFDEVAAWQGMLWVGSLGGGVGFFFVGLVSLVRRAVASRRGGPVTGVVEWEWLSEDLREFRNQS